MRETPKIIFTQKKSIPVIKNSEDALRVYEGRVGALPEGMYLITEINVGDPVFAPARVGEDRINYFKSEESDFVVCSTLEEAKKTCQDDLDEWLTLLYKGVEEGEETKKETAGEET